jgi:hypothetical protein
MATTDHLSFSYAVSSRQTHSSIAARLAVFSVTALLCLAIVLPVITISDSLPWFKIEQLALPLIILVYAWLSLTGQVQPIRWNWLFAVSGIFCCCVVISILTGWLFLEHRVIPSDFYELPKAFLPLAFFTFGAETRFSEGALRRLLSFFSLAIAMVCLYAWAQWFGLGISHSLTPLYSGGWHDEGALAHYRRVYSTMGNPNMLGQLMIWALGAFLLAAIFKIGNRVRNVVMAGACLVTLVMTGSRYGVINLGILLVLVFWLVWKSGRTQRAVALGVLALLPLFAWIGILVAGSNRATLDRVQTLSNPLATDSYRARTESLWIDAGHEFLRSPFFGNGPAKALYGEIVTDSEYLDVLKKFGAIGFLVYLGYFGAPLVILWRALQAESRSERVFPVDGPAAMWAIRLGFVMAVLALFMNIGMSTFYNAALQGFLWMWLGLGVGAALRRAPARPNLGGGRYSSQ